MPTERFNRLMSLAGLLFLLVTLGIQTAIYEHRHLVQSGDYPQYFMGGLIAKTGQWDALYPIPNPDSHTNPGIPQASTLRPKYRELSEQSGVSLETYRYIQLPTLAMFFLPLAWIPYQTGLLIWSALMAICAWGLGVQAGVIYSMARGRVDRFCGVLTLAVCISPQAHRVAREANLSLPIALAIAYVVMQLARRDSVSAGWALFAAALTKYAVLVLLPLHIILGRWRTIAWPAALSIASVATSLPIMGTGPYSTFFHEIAPKLGRCSLYAENDALYAYLLRITDSPNEGALPQNVEIGFRVAEFLGLAVVLITLLVKRDAIRTHIRCVFAGAITLLTWLLVFSPIFWEHYHEYLIPFWGWLAVEATRSRGRLFTVLGIMAITYSPSSMLLRALHKPLPEASYHLLLWSAMLMGILAVYSLWREGSTTGSATEFSPSSGTPGEGRGGGN